MLPQIESLLILQDRDRRRQDLVAQLEKLPVDEKRAKSKLEADRLAVENAKQADRANEIEVKKVSLDVDTRRTTIARLKKQQFETRKNEEYTALGHEVERYTADIDKLETRQLELMETGDALKTRLREAEAALARTAKLIEEDLAAIEARRQRIDSELEELAAERGRLASDVDPDWLRIYERLFKNKHGLVVAPMKNGQCGGCHVKLVPATTISVISEKVVTQCENCSRILYADD